MVAYSSMRYVCPATGHGVNRDYNVATACMKARGWQPSEGVKRRRHKAPNV